jgi:hypothetical protein
VPSKHEGLSSNPNTSKKKEEEEEVLAILQK